jgi:predicted  nucleic acid-binding Zn-ribbon protein
MSSLLNNYNPSILAIPAYLVLSIIPHSYALNVATRGELTKWDNRNPRSTTMKAKLKERLDDETYAKYERLEACHANGTT